MGVHVSRSSRAIVYLAVIFALSHGASSSTAIAPPVGYSPVTTRAAANSITGLNTAPLLPRVAAGGATLSDMGRFAWWVCSGNASATSCALDVSLFTPARFLSEWSQPPPNSPYLYIEGVVLYSAVHIAIAAAAIISTFLFVVGRYGLVCFRAGVCTTLRCGAPWPTQKGRWRTPWSGFIELPATGAFGYSKFDTVVAITLMVCFMGLVFVLGITCQSLGNQGLTVNTVTLASAGGLGTATAGLVKASLPILMTFASALASDTLGPFFLELNDALSSGGVSLNKTLTALECANKTLYSLPDASEAGITVDIITAALKNMSKSTISLLSGVAKLKETAVNVAEYQATFNVTLSEMGSAFTALTPPLASALGSAQYLMSVQSVLLNASSGLLPSAISDLTNLATYYPATSQFDVVAGASPLSYNSSQVWAIAAAPDVGSLGLVPHNFGPANALQLSSATRTLFWDSLVRLTDLGKTANTLDAINANFTALTKPGTGGLALLNASLTATAIALAAVPRASSYNATLHAYVAAAKSVNLNLLVNDLEIITSLLRELPKFDNLTKQVSQVAELAAAVEPCLMLLSEQFLAINTSLVSLPPAVSGIVNISQVFSPAQGQALSNFSGLASSIAAANATLRDVNTTTFLSQMQASNATVNSQLASFNFPSLFSRVNTLDASLASSLAPYFAQIATLNETLLSSYVPPTSIATLRALDANLTSLQSVVRFADLEYAALARGSCNSSLSLCLTNADCGPVAGNAPNVCNLTLAGVRRCATGWFPPLDPATGPGLFKPYWWRPGAFTPSTTVGQTFRVCAYDTDCQTPRGTAVTSVSTYRCLGDITRAATLATTLNGAGNYTSNFTATLAAAIAAVNSVNGSNAAAAVTQLKEAQSAVAGINTVSYQSKLAQLQSGFSTFDANGTLTTLTSMRNTIDAVPLNISNASGCVVLQAQAPDTASTCLDALFVQISANLADLRNNWRPLVSNATSTVRVIKTVFQDKALANNASLSSTALAPVALADGLAGVLRSMTSTVDGVLNAIATQQSLLPVSPSSLDNYVTSYVKPHSDPAQSINGFVDTSSNGPIYYLALAVFGPTQFVRPTDATALYVLTNRAGEAYSSYSTAIYCVTTACLTNTIQWLNTGNIGTLSVPFPPLSVLPPLATSREGVFLLLWLAPLIALLFGLWSFLGYFCCRASRWQKVPASCMAGCLMCQLPFILAATAITFPLFILLGDVCASGANVGYSYILSSGDGICSVAGGNGTADACTYGTSLDLTSGAPLAFNATFDLPKLYRGILGGCPAVGSSLDTLYSSLRAASVQVRLNPPAAAEAFLAQGVGGLSLQPALTLVLLNAVTRASIASAAAVEAFASGPLSCPSLSGAVLEVKEAVCTGVVAPLWWYVSAWLLTAWCIILCGIPGSLCARKRLVGRVWGPAVAIAVDLQEQALDARLLAAANRPPTVIPSYSASGNLSASTASFVAPDFRPSGHNSRYTFAGAAASGGSVMDDTTGIALTHGREATPGRTVMIDEGGREGGGGGSSMASGRPTTPSGVAISVPLESGRRGSGTGRSAGVTARTVRVTPVKSPRVVGDDRDTDPV